MTQKRIEIISNDDAGIHLLGFLRVGRMYFFDGAHAIARIVVKLGAVTILCGFFIGEQPLLKDLFFGRGFVSQKRHRLSCRGINVFSRGFSEIRQIILQF